MDITYTDNVSNLTANQLVGFFVGWSDHPSPAAHLCILRGSYAVWLAFDDERCVGFINALSDGVFYASIPLLEVLPEYQRQGIGTELVRRMVATLGRMYAIDIVCDESVSSFYATKGFYRCVGMVKRTWANQGAANCCIPPGIGPALPESVSENRP
jgi:ribosomal protein S18 acetylase RimI-like enzyme